MLRLTLYKNCKINDKYSQVYSLYKAPGQTNSVFDNYLATLSNLVISDLDEVYYQKNGILNFDYELATNTNIYQFNYFKVDYYNDDTDNLIFTRYCFINDIDVRNGIVYLEYKEDIFHSYFDKIKNCLPSYLSRKRVQPLLHSPVYNLPVEYDGNNNISYTQIEQIENHFYLILQLQTYSVDQSGNPTERSSSYALVDILNHYTQQYVDNFNKADLLRTYIPEILKLTQKKLASNHSTFSTADLMYFEISNIIIIPKSICNNINSMAYSGYSYIYDKDYVDAQNPAKILYRFEKFAENDNIEIYNKSITNNFKTLKIGTLLQNFEVNNNGTDIKLKLKLYTTSYSFDILLLLGNSLISITDSFKLNIPYSYLNGDTLAQQRIERNLKTINGITKIGVGIAETSIDIASAIGSGGVSLAGTAGKITTKSISKKLKSGARKTIKTSQRIPGTASGLDLTSDAITGLGKSIEGITNLIEITSPVYSSSRGVFVDNDIFTIIFTGLVKFEINPDNENFVKDMCNQTGYIVYKMISDISSFNALFLPSNISSVNATYDIIKFENANIIGDFPQYIANELDEILENGFKMIYSSTTETDSYFVG